MIKSIELWKLGVRRVISSDRINMIKEIEGKGEGN